MIAGSRADSLFYSKDAVQCAGSNAQLHLIDGASHIQLYRKPEYVEKVCRIPVYYFHKHLH